MFTTITEVRCRPGRETDVENLCKALREEIRAEPGCIDLRIYRDATDGSRLIFVAEWENERAWQAHIETPRQRELAAWSMSEAGKAMMVGWSSQHLHEIGD